MEFEKPKEYNEFFDEKLGKYPWIFELEDGVYSGIQGGYVVNIDGKEYKVPNGYRGFNIRVTYEVKGNKVIEL